MVDLAILAMPVFRTLCDGSSDEEFDACDLAAHRVVALADGEVRETLPVIYADERVTIGRVAVDAACRGRGIASATVALAMNEQRSLHDRRDEFPNGGMPHLATKNYSYSIGAGRR